MWDLLFVLKFLSNDLYVLFELISLTFLIFKMWFLVTLNLGHRRSKVHAMSGLLVFFQFIQEAGLLWCYSFAWPLISGEKPEPWYRPRLYSDSRSPMGSPESEYVGCYQNTYGYQIVPTRALREKTYHLDCRGERCRLFLPSNTFLPGWRFIWRGDHLRLWLCPWWCPYQILAHDIRGFAALWWKFNNVSLAAFIKAAFWQHPTTFTAHYLGDM